MLGPGGASSSPPIASASALLFKWLLMQPGGGGGEGRTVDPFLIPGPPEQKRKSEKNTKSASQNENI